MNETEKRSYALGCDIGNNLKTMGVAIEKDAFEFEKYVFAQVDKLKNLRD